MDTNQQKIEEIVKQGDYRKIYDDLKNIDALNNLVEELRQKYAERFKAMDFEPEQKIWELMAIENLYDSKTFQHSERTFEIANEIITKTLIGPHEEKILLKTLLEESGITPHQVKVAAIGHDIGKIKIPKEILHNTLTDNEMNHIFIDMIHRGVVKKETLEKTGLNTKESEKMSEDDIIKHLQDKGLRAVSFVPLSEAFPEKTQINLSKMLSQHGLSSDHTIRQVAVIHEFVGQKIFEDMGEPIIADLVGHHHNYKKRKEHEMNHKISIPALHVNGLDDEFGVYNIIKIADAMDSLQSVRSYKKSMTKISAFAELIRQVSVNWLEKRMLYLWMDNEYRELPESSKKGEKENVEKIEEFLRETKKLFTME